MTDPEEPFAGDEIGPWTEIKLEITREYAKPYSLILSTRRNPSFHHVYVDGFAGAGLNKSRATGGFIPGSPLNALHVEPPFREYFFVDMDRVRVAALEEIAAQRPDVHVYHGDCNEILLEKVFPQIQYKDYRRGLCLLDPYGLKKQVRWETIAAAGALGTVDLFFNFPIIAVNRGALRKDPERITREGAARMDTAWGDGSWRDVAYRPAPQGDLFIEEPIEKVESEALARAFRQRLRRVAGFKHVPEPIPLRNSRGGLLFYLFFASPQGVAGEIAEAIFAKYRGG